MQLLARYCGEERQLPPECRRCGGTHFHRHGFYERWILWVLGCSPERLKVNRFLCIGCLTTTSVLPWGILTYRLLSLALVMEHLWDEEQERCRDLLSSYRRRWYQWYPQLRRDMGLLFGRLPRDACEGWHHLAFEEMNPKLVDQTGCSLFGRYRIHAPQKVV